MGVKNERTGILVVDGDCGFCIASVTWIKKNWVENLNFIEYQKADLPRLGLSEEDCRKEVQFVHENRTFSGAAAYPKLLKLAPKRSVRFLGSFLGAPFIRIFVRMAYKLIARNRSKLPGGSAYCEIGS